MTIGKRRAVLFPWFAFSQAMAALAALSMIVLPNASAARERHEAWVGAWASSPSLRIPDAPYPGVGDHLHPSDAGYRAMAEAIDLNLFR